MCLYPVLVLKTISPFFIVVIFSVFNPAFMFRNNKNNNKH